MIPKIIHYCWFGGGILHESVQKCIASWKKYCPDYEIIEWNESNFDINFNDFTREAYEAKKYAFVSDVARLYALTEFGGIYMDTDMEVLRPIDRVLNCDAFCCFHDGGDGVGTAIMACVKGFPIFEEFLKTYGTRSFYNSEGKPTLAPNNGLFTDLCVKHGLKKDNSFQTIDGMSIFPSEYFFPKNSITKGIKITENTLAIHNFDGSWYSDIKDCKQDLKAKYKFLPQKVVNFIAYFKMRGFKSAIAAAKRYIKEKCKT